MEPLVREALARLPPQGGLPSAPVVGGYWTRGNEAEIDLVGADREPVVRELVFLGSVTWRENAPFDGHDLAALHAHRARLTDRPVPLLAVSRRGTACSGGLTAALGPAELLDDWRH